MKQKNKGFLAAQEGGKKGENMGLKDIWSFKSSFNWKPRKEDISFNAPWIQRISSKPMEEDMHMTLG